MRLYVCVFWAAMAVGQTASIPKSSAFVQGQVVFAPTGEPVAKAHVSLVSDRADLELLATTDATGHFRFADVQPDSYQLLAAKSGFLSGHYGELRQGDTQTLLRLKAGEQCKELVLRLFPASSLSGQIQDADGDPLAGYAVTLWQRNGRGKGALTQAVDQTKTDRKGNYRFEGLLPGTYWLSADPLGTDTPAQSAHQVLVDSEGKATRLHDYPTFFPSA